MVHAVFVFEGGDLAVFPSLEKAAGSVEAIDVENDEYDFFGDDGTLLRPEVQGLQVMLHVTDKQRPVELRERLREYLAHPRVALDATLADDPVAAAQVILQAGWGRRPFRWFPWLDKRLNGAGPPHGL